MSIAPIRNLLRVPTVLLLLMLLALGAVAQAQPSIEALDEEARVLFIEMGRPDKAAVVWKRIVDEFSGTEAAAGALFMLADYPPKADGKTSVDYLQQIIDEYPGTDFEFIAKLELLEIQPGDQPLREVFDNFAVELGGPSILGMNDDQTRFEAKRAIQSISDETLLARLYSLYDRVWSYTLNAEGFSNRDLYREDALEYAKFLKETFEPLGYKTKGFIRMELSLPYSLEPESAVAPAITVEAPQENATTSPLPAIQVLMFTGGKNVTQLDLSTLSVKLDNRELARSLDLKVSYASSSEESPLETVRFEYTPSTPLAAGPHILELTVQSREVPNLIPSKSATVTRRFVVGRDGGGGEEMVLNTICDTILTAREPHRNEGFNPTLTLEKIQGKATRSAVTFNLSEVDPSGLSSATLILTINSNQAVNGWGNGRTISVQPITTPWQEGNGWNFGLKKKDQVAGDGAGATWFSPVDENISNDSSNSAVNWNGAASSVSPPTSPPVQIVNSQSGEVTFDVTADVLNGAEHGWLILKDQENVGSKVSFYSREGAAAAGNPDLAPRLLLEFGQVASKSSGTQSETLLSRIGFGSIGTKLRPVSGSEVHSVKQLLQENRVVALAVEQLVSQATLANPVANWTTRLAYRSWVSESMQIAANLEMARSQV